MSAPSAGLDRSVPPPPGPLREFHFPAVHRAALSNGVQVLVAESHDFPVVSFGLLVRAGGVHEEAEQAGVSALAGDLLETGAGGRSGVEIAEALEGLGVLTDISTSWDTTFVGLTALRSRVDAASEILAELVRRPDFPPAEVDRLRSARLAGISQRRASPGGLASEAIIRFMHAPGSTFARPLGGTRRTVEGITREDVLAFHAARYTPAGSALVVAGDVTPGEAVRLAEERFGDWAGAPPPFSEPEAVPHPSPAGVVLVDRPGSVQAEIRAGHVGISWTDEDYIPVQVMNQLLGGAHSSRLNQNLRERNGYTYSVTSGFTARRHRGPFVVSTAVQSEVAGPAIREILHEVRELREAPVSAGELEDVRSYLAGIFPLRLETVTGILGRLVQLATYGLPDDYFEHYRSRILEVSADEVLRVARKHLRPQEMAVVVVGDAAQLRGPLEELGIGEIRVLAPEELEG